MLQTDPLPIATLFAVPAFSGAQILPDGKLVAYLAPWRKRLNVFVGPVERAGAGPSAQTWDWRSSITLRHGSTRNATRTFQ